METTDWKLIVNVQKHPCLYDKKNSNFVRLKRAKAWKTIALHVGLSDNNCKERWRSLRDRYVRECKAQTSQNVKTQWVYFEMLSFLKGMYGTKRLDILTEKLVENVIKYPCIYDRNNIGHRNKAIKAETWEAIADVVGVAAHHCRIRWRSLRDRFVRENNRNPESDSDTTQWKYFKLLSFLKDHIGVKKTNTDIDWDWKNCLNSNQNVTSWSSENSRSPTHRMECNSSFSLKTEIGDDPLYVEEGYVESIHDLCMADTNLVETKDREKEKDKDKKKIEINRNSDFFKVLDSYLLQLPERTQDDLKIQFLNTVYQKIQESGLNY